MSLVDLMKQIVIASGNKGKCDEIRQIMQGLDYQIISMKEKFGCIPEIEENGKTFYDNALLKVTAIYEKCGCWTLADDSGLEVDALDGAPGVYSARFAGVTATSVENNQKLLKLLEHIPAERRTARFKCVMVLKTSDAEVISAEGTCEGKIGFALSGSGGFGYDPLFTPDGYEHSFGELSASIKNRISHRSIALNRLRQIMEVMYV
ncbi:MAG TPA: RdgB/HAM1 family non-canonical purine NTP pyrophosphatase [Chitinispirillaceae bacterium]|nr:RdgB/HAM1 family non-canonical purine NTP pyrophosphatase [Chitinispirillaceae bacterium]